MVDERETATERGELGRAYRERLGVEQGRQGDLGVLERKQVFGTQAHHAGWSEHEGYHAVGLEDGREGGVAYGGGNRIEIYY
jgi:hypothetical protein